MVLALGMPEHIPNTQGREIAGTAECKYRSAFGVDESRLEFWLPHLSGLYNNEVPSTIEGSCSRVNFPASQCGVGPGKRGNRTSGFFKFPIIRLIGTEDDCPAKQRQQKIVTRIEMENSGGHGVT